jgi:hypothetical protein
VVWQVEMLRCYDSYISKTETKSLWCSGLTGVPDHKEIALRTARASRKTLFGYLIYHRAWDQR